MLVALCRIPAVIEQVLEDLVVTEGGLQRGAGSPRRQRQNALSEADTGCMREECCNVLEGLAVTSRIGERNSSDQPHPPPLTSHNLCPPRGADRARQDRCQHAPDVLDLTSMSDADPLRPGVHLRVLYAWDPDVESAKRTFPRPAGFEDAVVESRTCTNCERVCHRRRDCAQLFWSCRIRHCIYCGAILLEQKTKGRCCGALSTAIDVVCHVSKASRGYRACTGVRNVSLPQQCTGAELPVC